MRDAGDKSRDIHRMQAGAGQAAALARAEPAGEHVLRLWQEVEALLPARRTCGLYLRRVAGLSRGDKASRAVSKTLSFLRGTEGSNPSPSSAESSANPIFWIMVGAGARRCVFQLWQIGYTQR
jgi:hypothetical protein